MYMHVPNHQFDFLINSDDLPLGRRFEEFLSVTISGRRMSLCIAATSEERTLANELLNKRFAWRGYGENHRIPDKDKYTTFIAFVDDELIGTITLGVDSPFGLEVDSVFKDEIDRARNVYNSISCELIKFAFESGKRDYRFLAYLFHGVFLYGMSNYNCTDLFVEVNPRHIHFYECMLGFSKVGDLRVNHAVNAASQLMCLQVSEIKDKIAAHRSGSHDTQRRSLYPLFLSENEELLVKIRLDQLRHRKLHSKRDARTGDSHQSANPFGVAKLAPGAGDSEIDRAGNAVGQLVVAGGNCAADPEEAHPALDALDAVVRPAGRSVMLDLHAT